MNLKLLFDQLVQRRVPMNAAVLFLVDLAGASLGNVANALGCSKSTVCRAIESDSPKDEVRQAIAEILEFDPWESVLTGSLEPETAIQNSNDPTPAKIIEVLRQAGLPLHRAAVMLAADRGVTLDAPQMQLLQSGLGSVEVRQTITAALGVDPWEPDAGVQCVDLEELLQVLKDADVPLHKAVALLSELAGTSLAAITRQAGCRRNSAYAAMRGEFAPPQTLREAMQDAIGIDPWVIYEGRRPRGRHGGPAAAGR